jgi:hypothetical protein
LHFYNPSWIEEAQGEERFLISAGRPISDRIGIFDPKSEAGIKSVGLLRSE